MAKSGELKSASDEVLRVEGLVKIYDQNKENEFRALSGVDLAVERGESVAIIGKSGSGKSTLMHLLALLDRPTSGEVVVEGDYATKLSAKELDRLRNEHFGFVFQQFFLNTNDSVLNNVILPLKIAGVPLKERKQRAKEALEAVDLADKVNSKAKDLSGGQKQRVCIARALVNNPSVVFADEPTGNLDSATGDKIINLLFEMNKKKNITLIVVTHDEDLAKRCSRQVHIVDGKIDKLFKAKAGPTKVSRGAKK